MTKKEKEYKSLKIAQRNMKDRPYLLQKGTRDKLNGKLVNDWVESPDILLDCESFYLGLEHFEAKFHTVPTMYGRRKHALTDVWQRAEESGLTGENPSCDKESMSQRIELVNELLGSRLGNLANPQLYEEFTQGILYSLDKHLNKIGNYQIGLRNKLGSDSNIKVGFLIDWRMQDISILAIPETQIQSYLSYAIPKILEVIARSDSTLDYLYVNFFTKSSHSTFALNLTSDILEFEE